MSTLIVCGSKWAPLEAVFSILQNTPLVPAHEDEISRKSAMSVWHDRFFRPKAPDSWQRVKPGKAARKAAKKMLGVSGGQSVRGWADSRSVWILDFWREVSAAEKRYVLVHEDPHHISSRLIADGSTLHIEAVLAEWMAHEREMLRFAYSHRGECLLVEGRQVLANPQGFLDECSKQLLIDFDISPAPRACASQSTGYLNDALAGQVIALYPEVEALRAEVESSLTWSDPLTQVRTALTERESLMNAIDELQSERLIAEKLRGQRQDALMELNRLPSQLQLLEEELLGIERDWKDQHQKSKQVTEHLLRDSKAQTTEQSAGVASCSDEISSQTSEIDCLSTDFSHLRVERDELINKVQVTSLLEPGIELSCLNSWGFESTASDAEQLYRQLLQVQEELEECYLANQSLRLDVRAEALQSARWRHLIEVHPDYQVLVQAYKLTRA